MTGPPRKWGLRALTSLFSVSSFLQLMLARLVWDDDIRSGDVTLWCCWCSTFVDDAVTSASATKTSSMTSYSLVLTEILLLRLNGSWKLELLLRWSRTFSMLFHILWLASELFLFLKSLKSKFLLGFASNLSELEDVSGVWSSDTSLAGGLTGSWHVTSVMFVVSWTNFLALVYSSFQVSYAFQTSAYKSVKNLFWSREKETYILKWGHLKYHFLNLLCLQRLYDYTMF